MTNKLLCITSGEPAGIGPEICLDLAFSSYNSKYSVIVIGDIELLRQRAALTGKKVNLVAVAYEQLAALKPNMYGTLNILHIPCPTINCLGTPTVANADYVINILDLAIQICKDNLSNTIITAPLNKDIINKSGIKFSGHTEYFAEKFGGPKVVMMLSNPQLNVALLTTHLPLKDVPALVTTDNLNQTLSIIHESFRNNFGIPNPKIAVCGLNPHAGENGYLGEEEIKIINPVIRAWQEKGCQVSGSYPADTVFNRAAEFDVILAMYHDQGLPVVKFSDFEHGVNTTLGLPVIRTSVDHGTALDIAGTGKAKSQSLLAAIKFAIQFDEQK